LDIDGCVVAKSIWSYVSEFSGFEIGTDYVSVASKWLHDKFNVANTISTAVLRGLWLTRNDFVFNKQDWSDVKLILRRVLKLLLEWKVIFKEAEMMEMTNWLSFLECQIHGPLRITSRCSCPGRVRRKECLGLKSSGEPKSCNGCYVIGSLILLEEMCSGG
jgi:hypothetical protein